MLLRRGLAEGAALARLVHFLLCWCTSCSGKRQSRAETSAPPKCATARVRRPIGFRPPSDRFPSAVQSDSVRHPIRFRPLSDWIPSAVGGKVLGKTLQERCAQRQYYRRLRHLWRERISLFLLSAP